MHAKIKYMDLILSLMYVKKIHQFLSIVKQKHAEEKLFIFLPHGVDDAAGE